MAGGNQIGKLTKILRSGSCVVNKQNLQSNGPFRFSYQQIQSSSYVSPHSGPLNNLTGIASQYWEPTSEYLKLYSNFLKALLSAVATLGICFTKTFRLKQTTYLL